jgi:hypothetical protein
LLWLANAHCAILLAAETADLVGYYCDWRNGSLAIKLVPMADFEFVVTILVFYCWLHKQPC